MPRPVIILSKKKNFPFIRSILPDATCIERLDDIPKKTDRLISYSTGVIVPREILDAIDVAINFHGAPPFYPGRDPQHWAAYDQASIYGATAHWMWPRVDAGPIVSVILTNMALPAAPYDYRMCGERCLQALFTATAASICGSPAKAIDMQWSGIKRSRNDLIAMCDMRGMSDVEKQRRRQAFVGFEQYFIED